MLTLSTSVHFLPSSYYYSPPIILFYYKCAQKIWYFHFPPPHSPRTSTFSEIKECQKRFMVESHTEDDDDAILTFNDWVLEPETKTEKMVVSFFFLSTKWWYLMCHGSCVTWNFMVTLKMFILINHINYTISVLD